MDDDFEFADRSMRKKICIDFPEQLSSEGESDFERFHNHVLPMVEIQILMIFFITMLSHNLLKRLGFTKMTSELIAGMLVTPRVLGDISTSIFTTQSEEILAVATKFNYMLFLFLMGVRTDINLVRRTGKSAIVSGILGLLIPLVIGVGLVKWLVGMWKLDDALDLALINVAFIYSVTPFENVVSLVNELRIMNSELGLQAISVGTASDMISIWTFFVLYSINVMTLTKRWVPCAVSMGGVFFYVAILYFLVRPAMRWVVKRTPEGAAVSNKYVYAVFVGACLASLLFDTIGQSIVIGPYFLGLTVPAGQPFGSTLEDKFKTFVRGLFVPLFISFAAMKIDLKEIRLENYLQKSVAIIISCMAASKFLIYLISALCFKLPKRDAFALAFILSYRGIIELGCFFLSFELKIINDDIFSMAGFAIFVTQLLVPNIVRILYDPSRKYAGYKVRNIMALPPKSELPLLACIYRSEDIAPIVSVLDASAPNKERPLSVHVLHILKLVGQSHPTFLTHGLDKNNLSDYKKSKEVIFSFKKLAKDNSSVTSLRAYTSMTIPEAMHEDVCMLALSNLTCFIVLPFHRSWTLHGLLIQEDDNTLRTLNCSVLTRAPCSVGILVDKGNLVRRRNNRDSAKHECLNVGMLFFGGKDDREGLALAKRMAQNPLIQLTVVHFCCDMGDDGRNMTWETILDNEQMNDFKAGIAGQEGHVTYVKEWVQDGLETVDKIRNMVSSYNLVIVGRRYNQTSKQTAGLESWSDFPELGVIGDLLISNDFSGNHSVLVVQQQIQLGSSHHK